MFAIASSYVVPGDRLTEIIVAATPTREAGFAPRAIRSGMSCVMRAANQRPSRGPGGFSTLSTSISKNRPQVAADDGLVYYNSERYV
jgi:hypothetical protein